MSTAICEKCGKSFALRIKLENGKWYRAGNNRHNCFECKPIRHHNSDILDGSKQCGRCKIVLPLSEFYINSVTKKHKSICKQCSNHRQASQILPRQLENKRKAIEYKGGKCVRCGYHGFYGALEFHHIDPKSKTRDIGTQRKQNLQFEDWKEELDKCELVCANCHREIHHEEYLKANDLQE